MPHCGVIILAAGGSTRLGEPKQLLEFEGRTLLEKTVQTALDIPAESVVVVLGAETERCSRLLEAMPVEIVLNPDWQEGLASSIRVGVERLKATKSEGALLLLCDQILLSTAHLRALLSVGAGIVASAYGGTIGAPIYLARRYFDELLTLQGDIGARALLQAYADAVVTVPFSEGIHDIDTAEDWRKFSGG